MSETELMRFTPKALSAHQIRELIDVVCGWHSVRIDMVGPDQLGVIGPEQQRFNVIREASNGTAQH